MGTESSSEGRIAPALREIEQARENVRRSRVLDAAYGLVREEDDTERYRLQKSIVVVSAAAGAPLTTLAGVTLASAGAPRAFVVTLFVFAALVAASVVVFIVIKRWMAIIFNLLLAGNLVVVVIGAVQFGGVVESGGNALWGIVPPVLALLVFGSRAGLAWFAVYMVILMWSIFSADTGPSADGDTQLIFANTLGGVSILIMVLVLYFTQERDRAQAAVEIERRRSDLLLLGVLPDEIVDRLKSGAEVIADEVRSATVLFADIAEFTPMSSAMSADEVVALLDEVFRAFDRIAERYPVEKIKTIGDCYMVAAGVPAARDDHAVVMAQMALELTAMLSVREFQGRKLQFRMGLNSGPLVAGVIGEQKFIYDLWGDTVNTASRMESHGVPGKIQITDATRQLLGGGFTTSLRGEIDVKGKGMMPVWFLVGGQDGEPEPRA